MDNQPIIVKKIKKGGHAAHGGAWKVAYADFVTAMMAFFLLLWLLNVTTDEQKMGIADYFAPAAASKSSSGAGGILGGRTMSPEGARISDGGVPSVVVTIAPPPEETADRLKDDEGAGDGTHGFDSEDDEFLREAVEKEEKSFDKVEQALRQALESDPELSGLAEHLLIENTKEGLRIQIVDQFRESMFEIGSSRIADRAKALMGQIARAITNMPNQIAISGHTDATPFRENNGYSNWELSADRANASRRALVEAGVPPDRFAEVTGRAARDPMLVDDPTNPGNRRISILLLRTAQLPDPTAN
ncbi:flagellar motor protein MotB [Oceanibacterium hippocampi]|uniref:Motility protein B n=1 Tax=Oceanibacterium hippocampi TaxID=745714 RepID=A0A1Y5SSW2_9PROT|nr:flagellar motor protein MotB [Oceanibacterium hippocampi]SLN44466.1 Motility protein B [Oceanibacterium hippocampi]